MMREVTAGALLAMSVAAAAAAAQAPQGAIVIGDDQARGAVETIAGETVQFALPANAGTGYVWRAEADAGLAVSGPEERPAAPVSPGTTGYRMLSIFSVTPARAGAYTVRFILARPWEKTTAREAIITVSVK